MQYKDKIFTAILYEYYKKDTNASRKSGKLNKVGKVGKVGS